MTWPPAPGSFGAIIAIIVLILVIVLWAIGQMPPLFAGLVGGLAVARLT